jgi:hypothetical protein
MATEAKEMRVKLTRFMKRMKNSNLIGAWDRWAEFTTESIEMRVKIKRTLAKMMNRQMAGAFARYGAVQVKSNPVYP